MRAMILAAGLGTRLRPLSLVRPKVLVPLMGTAVLDFWIWQLHDAGFEAVIVNAYHLHEELTKAVRERDWPIPVHVRVERALLGTGGGMRNVLDFFEGQPFAVVNGDTICRVPLGDLYRQHLASGARASLLMHDFPQFNNVAVNGNRCVQAFGQEAMLLGEEKSGISLEAFTGIHVLHPSVLEDIPPQDPADIIEVYRKLILEGCPPRALSCPGLYWREMGSLQAYRKLTEELCALPRDFLPPLETGEKVWIHPEARVAADVRLKGFVVVGKGTHIMEGAELEDVILWDNVRVGPHSRMRRCMAADGVLVEGFHEDETLVEVRG